MIWSLTWQTPYGEIDPGQNFLTIRFFPTERKALAYSKYIRKDDPDTFDFSICKHGFVRSNEGIANLCEHILEVYS